MFDWLDVAAVHGIGEYTSAPLLGDDQQQIGIICKLPGEGGKAFLILRKNTLEVRTDARLAELLRQQYESVMQSRYFGRGGIEIVHADQLTEDELLDLVRLSYNLTAEQG